jgi:hypothetical protein
VLTTNLPTPLPKLSAHASESQALPGTVGCSHDWPVALRQAGKCVVQDTVKHPGMVAQRLATEAINAGSGDNITVAVLFLQPSSGTLERIYCESRATL